MEIKKLIETLHPLERAVFPHLSKCNTLSELVKASGLKEVEVMRALQWLENKNILKIGTEATEIVSLDKNGKKYSEDGLPESNLLKTLKGKMIMDNLMDAAGLDKQEFNISLGMLKGKAAIKVDSGKVELTPQGKKLLEKESPEQALVKKLAKKPVESGSLKDLEKLAYENLKKRKQIIKTDIVKTRKISLTGTGKKLVKHKLTTGKVIDRLTPEMLAKNTWQGKKFRRYDVKINVPEISGGKRHFVNQAIEYVRKIWIEMGFKEMTGPLIQTSFWNFDSLFVPQDHPARDLQDTFFIKDPAKGRLPDKKTVDRVKAVHENGGKLGSTGWQYKWDPEDAKTNVARTHTTVLSAQTIAQLKKEDWPAKYFAVGRCFRNETMDWSHLFEFNQVEGIVVDPDVNFRHHLGYLREFFKKLGFPDARFRPAYFPYTEMSLEIDVFHPVHKKWIELGGTGIFRPEVVEPLLGEAVPVLAWGPGFDRIIMDYYSITDMRDLYKNDIRQLRNMKAWLR